MVGNGKSARHTHNVLVLEKCANIDYKYGPYPSVEEAFETLTELEVLTVGLTVGVVEDGKIKEYWFEEKCESIKDLVEKNVSKNINCCDTCSLRPKFNSLISILQSKEIIDNEDIDMILKDISFFTLDSCSLDDEVCILA